jgi:hypothetical protein
MMTNTVVLIRIASNFLAKPLSEFGAAQFQGFSRTDDPSSKGLMSVPLRTVCSLHKLQENKNASKHESRDGREDQVIEVGRTSFFTRS